MTVRFVGAAGVFCATAGAEANGGQRTEQAARGRKGDGSDGHQSAGGPGRGSWLPRGATRAAGQAKSLKENQCRQSRTLAHVRKFFEELKLRAAIANTVAQRSESWGGGGGGLANSAHSAQ